MSRIQVARNPTNNSKFKNCLFGATNVVKNSNKWKYVYNGYGTTSMIVQVYGVLIMIFSGNVLFFGIDNSSSSHTDNRKNNFFEGPTFHINGSFESPEKKV